MTFSMKPLSCDPARIKGMSERLIISHYENNYGGAVKRLNLIEEKLAELDYGNAPGFLINGLKREQLIAMNSMVLHELFFDGLGEQSEPGGVLLDALCRDFGSYERWRSEFSAMGKALGGGSGWVLLSWITCSSINGRLITATRLPAARQFSGWICTNTRITSILAQSQLLTWIHLWQRSAGATVIVCSTNFTKGGGRQLGHRPI